MIEKKYDHSPVYGYIPKDKTRFADKDIFGEELWKYAILKKIKIWYGSTQKKGEDAPKEKVPLGIQCTYQDIVTGTIKTSEQHTGDLTSGDIETKELEIKEGDYVRKFNIGFDTYITHLKFTTNKGEFIEFGAEKPDCEKKITFNDSTDPCMIQMFTGYYNAFGLRALGVSFIKKKDFILINLMGVFRLRHIFKINEEEKNRWSKEENLNNLPNDMKAVAKVCNLPDTTFACVMKFCV